MAVTKYTAKVEQAIKDATAVLAILETALTLAYNCNKEVDYVTDGMTDFLDAASATQKVSLLKKLKPLRRLKQRLIKTQNKLLEEMTDTKITTDTPDINRILVMAPLYFKGGGVPPSKMGLKEFY